MVSNSDFVIVFAAAPLIFERHLPEELRGSVFYEPGTYGFEKEVARRLQWWADLKAKTSASSEPDGGGSKEPA
jgi:putative ATPase